MLDVARLEHLHDSIRSLESRLRTEPKNDDMLQHLALSYLQAGEFH